MPTRAAGDRTKHSRLEVFLWFSLGFCALVSQVVFQRECINVFSGNELSIGLVLFVWLLFGGIGSFTMGKATNRLGERGTLRLRFWFLVGLSVFLPGTLIAIRFARPILGIGPGEMAGLAPILAATFVCLAPVSFAQGGLFAVYCSMRTSPEAPEASRSSGSSMGAATDSRSKRASAVYSVEAAGAVCGGIVLHFLLTGRVLPFATLLLLSGIILVGACWQKRRAERWLHGAICVPLLVGVAVSLILSSSIELFLTGLAFGETKVTHVRETKYGRLVLTTRFEQKSLFENGLLLYSYPDRLAAEEAVHIPMLVHERPRSVLLLGGGCGGPLRELLKHGPERIDYVELDEALIKVSENFLPPDEAEALRHPSVEIHYSDARRFVAQSRSRYDVVILNLPRPTNAQLNRFFTQEFFSLVKKRLAPEGVLAVQVPSSESYLSDELKTFLCSIHNTLKLVFPTVALTPGETAHLLAADRPSLVQPTQPLRRSLPLSADVLLARLADRGIETTFVTDWSIPARFEFFRMRMIDEALKGCADSGARINRDFSPVCYHYALVLWGKELGSSVVAVYEWLGNRTRPQVYSVVVALCLAVLATQFASRKPRKVATFVSLASIGFLEVGVEMIMMIAYQIFFGNIYSMLALLVCAYMGGLAVGAFVSRNKLLVRPARRPFSGLLLLQGAAALFPLLAIALLMSIQQLGGGALVQVLFVAAILVSGAVGGALYVYGNAAYTELAGRDPTKQTAGTTYFADLVGSSIGAIVVTSFLLPILGVIESLVIASLVGLIGLLALGIAHSRGGS